MIDSDTFYICTDCNCLMSVAIYDVYVLLIICETPANMNSSMHIEYRAAELVVTVCHLSGFLGTEDIIDVTVVSCLTDYCFFPANKENYSF